MHGHSSHHVKAIEVFRGRLILYGCGDFLTDYEGVGGYEEFRGDLALMYFVELDSGTGELVGLRGRGSISVDEDGTHRLALDYEFAR